jgi:hypothetical protein
VAAPSVVVVVVVPPPQAATPATSISEAANRRSNLNLDIFLTMTKQTINSSKTLCQNASAKERSQIKNRS